MINVTEKRDELITYIESAESILITSHRSPDDDSISSTLAIRYWIKKNYPSKKVLIAYEDEINQRWHDFVGFDSIEKRESVISSFTQDLLICTDANQYSRFTEYYENIDLKDAKLVCIDHHKSEPDRWDLKIIDSNAASTAEILYQLLYSEPDPEFAKIILLGILGDTMNMSLLDATTVDVLDYVKQLVVDANIRIQSFKATYDYFSNEAIAVAKQLVTNQQTLEVGKWPKFNISYINEEDGLRYPKVNLKEGSAMYIRSFGMPQKDVTWHMTLTPQIEGGVSISFRSLPESVNVRKISEAMGIGSGHDGAAGGKWRGEEHFVEAKVDEVLDWLKENEPIID